MILSSYWYSWRSFATMIVCKCANSSYLSLCLFILRIILLSGMSIQGLLRLIRLPLLCSGLLLGFVCTMRTAEPPWSMSVNDFSCGLMMNWPCSACLETRNYAVSDVVDGQLSKWTSSFWHKSAIQLYVGGVVAPDTVLYVYCMLYRTIALFNSVRDTWPIQSMTRPQLRLATRCVGDLSGALHFKRWIQMWEVGCDCDVCVLCAVSTPVVILR